MQVNSPVNTATHCTGMFMVRIYGKIANTGAVSLGISLKGSRAARARLPVRGIKKATMPPSNSA